MPRNRLWDVARTHQQAQDAIASARTARERSRRIKAENRQQRLQAVTGPGDGAPDTDAETELGEHVRLENDLRRCQSWPGSAEIDADTDATLRAFFGKPLPPEPEAAIDR